MKILLFANTDWYLFGYRLNLAEALRAQDHSVVLASPPGPYAQRLLDAGFDWRPIPLRRGVGNPLADLAAIRRLIRLYRAEEFDVVHHFTVKCVLYGSFAARRVRIPRVVNAITGLGYVFSSPSPLAALLRPLVTRLYRSLLKGTRVVFQNQEDLDYFLARKLATESQSLLIRGSGVDLKRFTDQGESPSPPRVTMVGRLLEDKGVREFVGAARLVRSQFPEAIFTLVGEVDEANPASLSRQEVERWTREGVVEWLGWQDDMVEVFRDAAIVCLPSYREGLPKALMEAAACGRPLVATDVPGCRAVVQNGVNGLLVPPKSTAELAKALEYLLADPDLRRKMGKAGRKLAEEQFAEEKIIGETLRVYEMQARA